MGSGLLARLNYRGALERLLRKVFPDHWSYLLGEVALFSFIALLLTGVFLGLYYEPGIQPTLYGGAFEPARGLWLPRSFATMLVLAEDVRLGDFIRRVHHFSAHLFIGSIVLHACRTFFNGAFRRPRELTWVLGIGLLLFAVFSGFTGYALPYDQRGGTALRMAYTQAQTLPWIGHRIAPLLGREFPTSLLLERVYFAHVFLLPMMIGLIASAHLALVVLQTHTQRTRLRPAATDVVGSPLWPEQIVRSGATALAVAGVLALLSALFPVAGTWIEGPFVPERQLGTLEPDWFLFFSEGAYRILPPIEWRALGTTFTGPFVGGVLLIAIVFTLAAAYPWIDRALYKWGAVDAHDSERPRDRPFRTAFGVAGLSFLVLLSCGVLNERIAGRGAAVYTFDRVLLILVVLLPIVVGLATFVGLRRPRMHDGAKRG